MKSLLKNFINKTLRIYTISAVESYLGILEEVKDDYIVLKSFFKDEKNSLHSSILRVSRKKKNGVEQRVPDI